MWSNKNSESEFLWAGAGSDFYSDSFFQSFQCWVNAFFFFLTCRCFMPKILRFRERDMDDPLVHSCCTLPLTESDRDYNYAGKVKHLHSCFTGMLQNALLHCNSYTIANNAESLGDAVNCQKYWSRIFLKKSHISNQTQEQHSKGLLLNATISVNLHCEYVKRDEKKLFWRAGWCLNAEECFRRRSDVGWGP